jgi:formate/nitrite transporter
MDPKLMLSPKETSAALSDVAQVKARATLREQFFLAVLAGMYIGFGSIVCTAVTSGDWAGVPRGIRQLIGGGVFGLGLMLVIIPGSELFTGNILMTIGLFEKRFHPARMLRNWVVVWIGNLAGAILLAFMMWRTGQLNAGSPIAVRAIEICDVKLKLGFEACFFLGILCNILVCLAVIMATSARTVVGKIAAIWFPIMAFVACGFEHSIANMYFLAAGLFAHGQFVGRFWEMFNNLIPVTLGNVVGGVALVLLHPKSQNMAGRTLARMGEKQEVPLGK